MKSNGNFDGEKYTQGHGEKRAQEMAPEVEARLMRVRAELAARGFRLMHRRNGQFWVMFERPRTLDEIEALEPQMAW